MSVKAGFIGGALVMTCLALGGCRKEEPAAPAPAAPPTTPAAAAPAPSPTPAPSAPATPPPVSAAGADRKALLDVLHQEIVCATHADEAADLLPILRARGYESMADYAKDMDRFAAADPEWARNAVEQADPARCK